MNKQRRKAIDAVREKLEELLEELEAIKDEEQEAFDNLPESLQDSERGDKMTEAIENLEYTIDYIEEITEQFLPNAME